MEKHIQHMRKVLEVLKQKQLKYFEFIIEEFRIKLDPEKVRVIIDQLALINQI